MKLFLFLSFGLLLISGNKVNAHSSSGGEKVIHINDETFNPAHITIKQGETVSFENTGKKLHWPASNIHPTHDIYPEFDSKDGIKPGASWSFTFEKAGVWRMHDHLNPLATGTITVEKNTKYNQKQSYDYVKKIKEGFLNIKQQMLITYFKVRKQEKEKYFKSQNLAQILEKNDEERLSFLLKLYGPELLMKKLFEESGKGTSFNCHVLSHKLGRESYRVLKEDALRYGIFLCSSGYIHGTIAAFVQDNGGENLIRNLDKMCSTSKSSFGKLGCYHASGHGLFAYYDNDLPKSLEACQEYDSRFKKINCYVGVFMENIGTYMGDSLSSHETVWLNKSDPYFPCNSISQDSLIQTACYSIQPWWMHSLSGNNMKKVADLCSAAEEKNRRSCFFGYGQEIAGVARFQPNKITSFCKNAKTDLYFDQCLIGAQGVVIDFWGTDVIKYGKGFCEKFPEQNRDDCLSRVNKRIADLHKN